MLSLFLSGILTSVGHHIFYSRLDGSAVQHPDTGARYFTQIWIIRYGTAFAFLTQSFLANTVILAYTQHVWINFRTEANTISTSGIGNYSPLESFRAGGSCAFKVFGVTIDRDMSKVVETVLEGCKFNHFLGENFVQAEGVCCMSAGGEKRLVSSTFGRRENVASA